VISRGDPVPGQELVEAGVWPEIDETEENVGKVPVRIDAAELDGVDGPRFRLHSAERSGDRSEEFGDDFANLGAPSA
jgi:hypothetical protein